MSMPLPHTLPSLEFFNDLYHRFLLSPKPSMKSMCLQAMAIVYGQCWEEIGAFNDTKYMVYRLIEVCGAGGGVGGAAQCGTGCRRCHGALPASTNEGKLPAAVGRPV